MRRTFFIGLGAALLALAISMAVQTGRSGARAREASPVTAPQGPALRLAVSEQHVVVVAHARSIERAAAGRTLVRATFKPEMAAIGVALNALDAQVTAMQRGAAGAERVAVDSMQLGMSAARIHYHALARELIRATPDGPSVAREARALRGSLDRVEALNRGLGEDPRTSGARAP